MLGIRKFNCVILFFSLGLIACSQSESDNKVIYSDKPAVSEIVIGSSISEMRLLNYQMSWSVSKKEGDDYPTVDVTLPPNTIMTGIFDKEKKLYSLETRSPEVSDDKGIKIGSDLKDVRIAYPQGNLWVGNENGNFVNYTTGGYLVIHFDHYRLDESCFLRLNECEIPNDLPVSKFVLYGDITE